MTTIIRDYNALKPEPRRAILERDNYTCQDCGYQGAWNDGTLDVHHIVPYSTGGEHTPDNLITLCDSCHHVRDRAYLNELKSKRTKDNAPLTGQFNIRLPKRPPFPSCSNYDAKAWRFIRAHASEGALFWNVAA